MYGYLENGYLRYAPDILRLEEVTIINPTDEQLVDAGYKKIIKTERPPYEEGFSFNSRWEEDEEEVRQVWDKVEVPPPPEPEPSMLDIVAEILTGERT